MLWQTKLRPPNQEHYLNRCGALRRCLQHADVMPPFLVAANCLFVLRKAFGSDWRIVFWLIRNIAHNYYQQARESAWFTWHCYIRTRSRDEIRELVDQELERITGDDHREWPDIVVDEEVV